MENPWNINSIYELQYFNCPSCIFKNSSKQEMVNHAYECHPESVNFLTQINDDSFSAQLNELVSRAIKISVLESEKVTLTAEKETLQQEIQIKIKQALDASKTFSCQLKDLTVKIQQQENINKIKTKTSMCFNNPGDLEGNKKLHHTNTKLKTLMCF